MKRVTVRPETIQEPVNDFFDTLIIALLFFLAVVVFAPSASANYYVTFAPEPVGFKTTSDLTPAQVYALGNNSIPWIKYEDSIKITWIGTGYINTIDGRNIATLWTGRTSDSSWGYGGHLGDYPPLNGTFKPTGAETSWHINSGGYGIMKLYGYTQGSGSDPYFYYYYCSVTEPNWTKKNAPTSSFSISPASNTSYSPITVAFTDTSTGDSITSYNWTVSGNTTVQTTRNMTYTFSSGGSYTISHGLENAFGSSISQQTYIVKTYTVPVAGLLFNQTSGSAPIVVHFIDNSTSSPTSFNTQIYDNTHNYQYYVTTDQVFDYTFTSSGMYDIYHEATNPAGTGSQWYYGFNFTGIAPTPTPTPSIPFPNQTGICQFQDISLGSGLVRPFDAYSTVISPSGNGIDNFYPTGSTNIITGSYTTEIGQYIYNEYNVSNELLYRSSYITGVCAIPTTTATLIQTLTPAQTYPTVTGTLAPNWSPVVTVTIIPASNVSTTLSTVPEGSLNATKLEELILLQNTAFQGYITSVKGIMTDANNIIMTPVVYALGPVSFITTNLAYVTGLFTQYFTTFTPLFTMPYQVMVSIINSFHWKVKAVITYGLIIDTILQIYNLKRGGYL